MPLLVGLLLAAGWLSYPDVRAGGSRGESDTNAELRRAAAGIYADLRTETLPNGLRVVLKPVRGSPVVTTMVAYRVGSVDEDLDHTGLAHYLEHLMFKGTARLKPGDIDRLTQRNGGSNNASTGEDYTVYYFDFAADRWGIALEIEADRMRNLRIDKEHEFQQEKGAVIEELQQDEDQPWDLEQKTILPLLFGKKAPMGHPVIGEEEHVKKATAKVIKAYYDRWYHPNNAVLVVCGGFDADEASARIKKLFGPIPRARLPERKPAVAMKRKGPLRKEFASKFEAPRLLLGYNGVRSGEADGYVLDVIQDLLSGGKTSRLYKRLVDTDRMANSVSSSNNMGRYPGWFMIQVEFLKGQDADRGEAVVLAEMKRLGGEEVGARELQRVRRRLLAGAIFGRESVHNLAENIAHGLMINDVDYLKTYQEKVAAVTPQDIKRVARKYFVPQERVAVFSLPRKEARGEGGKGTGGDREAARRRTSRSASSEASPGRFSLKDSRQVVLDNGLTLLLRENHRLPIVVAQAQVNHVDLLEPAEKAGVASLTGSMLDEGTARHTGGQIAELIEDVGGNLDMSSSGGEIKVLTPDRQRGLELLFECLTRPNFPSKEFTTQRNRQLSSIDDQRQQPNVRARQAYQKLVYGSHPYGRPSLGTRQTVAKLTAADCRAFHDKLFMPNNTAVAIVGDFDSEKVIQEVKRLTRDWKKKPLPEVKVPEPAQPRKFTQKIITLPEAAQLQVYLGHVGIRRTNPDYYKLLVMDNVLGTGSGLTDRLSAELRDRRGLAYTVSATITGSAGEEPGLFTCYIGTRPGNFELVKKLLLKEVERLRKEKPTRQEVEDAQKYLVGNLPFRVTTNEAVAGQLLSIHQYHLGFDYLEAYRKAVLAVTPEEVRQMAAQYLRPQRMVLVAAGAIGPEGKPLAKIPASRPDEKE
jgi:zinc protease